MKTRLIRTPMRLLLMLLAVIVTPLTASANGTKIGELCYILDDANLTAEVTYENENIDEPRYTSLPSDLTIPETVDYAEKTYSVTSIGSQAFFNCSGLKSIDLPDALTSIDSQAFQGCTGLTSVDILERVTIIGTWAFYGCSGMNSVTISSSVTQLGAYTFGDCDNLTTVTCNALTPPTGESSVFSNPENATLIVPFTVIDNYKNTSPWSSFGTIKAQEVSGEIVYNFDITNLTAQVTYENSSSPSYTNLPSTLIIPEKVTYAGNTYTVTSIGEKAFYGCKGLISVTLPASVTSIGTGAFYYCSGLKSINIPDGMTSISDYTFYNCSSLTSVEIPDAVTAIGAFAFYNCSNMTSIALPQTVTSIGRRAFEGCSGLTSINIPDLVTTISEYAFYGCSGLTSLDIPYTVTSIGKCAFTACSGLTTIDIPGSVTSIGDQAFYSCTGLTSATIPSSVTQMGEYVFGNCPSLKTVICHATTPPACGPHILANPKYATLFVPASALDVYKRTAPWNGFGSFKAIGDTPTGVSDVKDMCGIIVSSSAGVVTVKGLDSSEKISWYDLNGVKLGVATAIDGVAVFSAAPGSIVILHTGNSKSLIKVLVK